MKKRVVSILLSSVMVLSLGICGKAEEKPQEEVLRIGCTIAPVSYTHLETDKYIYKQSAWIQQDRREKNQRRCVCLSGN